MDSNTKTSFNKNRTTSDNQHKIGVEGGMDILNLSDQALGAVMMALQNSLMHQTDIVPVLKGLKFVNHPIEGLVVTNPPILRMATAEDA